MMKTTITQQNGVIEAILDGSLDTAASEQATRDLAPLLESNGRDIIIDCTSLRYISSSGLRILLSIRKSANKTGSTVTLTNVNSVIRDVLFTTGFQNLFTIK